MARIKIIIIMAVIFFLSSCNNSILTTPIGKIVNNPRDYEGKVVKVSGEVTESMNLLLIKYFRLKDKTGEIYIVTDKILPKQGASTSVKGHVQEAFTIGAEQFIVIMEDNENS